MGSMIGPWGTVIGGIGGVIMGGLNSYIENIPAPEEIITGELDQDYRKDYDRFGLAKDPSKDETNALLQELIAINKNPGNVYLNNALVGEVSTEQALNYRGI